MIYETVKRVQWLSIFQPHYWDARIFLKVFLVLRHTLASEPIKHKAITINVFQEMSLAQWKEKEMLRN